MSLAARQPAPSAVLWNAAAREIAVMMLAAGCFDESTDESSEGRCYTVAGFVGGLDVMVVLELRWKDLLKKYNLKFFKASQIENGFGEFAQYRDDPNALSKPLSKREKALIVEIKTAFVNLICETDGLYGIGTVLILPDFERLVQEDPVAYHHLPFPYYICGQLTMMEAGQMMLLSNQHSRPAARGNLRPVFDSHEEYSGRFKQIFDSFARMNPISSRYLLAPHYESELDHLTLQAADCLAYEARKLLIQQEFEPHRPERIAMTRLRKRVRRLYKLNYESLKLIAHAQTSDTIPLAPALENDLTLEF